MKRLILLTALLTSTSAFAEGGKFKGLYIQAGAGYGSSQANGENYLVASAYPGDVSKPTQTGLAAAVGLGYSFQFSPRFIVSLGADYIPMNTEYRSDLTISSLAFTDTIIMTTKNRADAYLQFGFGLSDSILFYMKGGMAIAQIDSVTTVSSDSSHLSGYIGGAGLRKYLSRHFYTLAEFNYITYSKQSVSGTSSTPANYTYTISGDGYSVLAGLGIQF